jgi:rubrerythrin
MEGGIDAWHGFVATGPPEQGLFLLDKLENPDDILSLALDLEEGSRSFYAAVAAMLEDEPSKETFKALAAAEAEHKKKLEAACREAFPASSCASGAEGKSSGGDYTEGAFKAAELTEWSKSPGRTPFEILDLSMQVEANSLDFYLKISSTDTCAAVKKILLSIIEEEKFHLKRIAEALEKAARDLPPRYSQADS